MLDKYISITIILFILSMISERVSNFLKLNLPEDTLILGLFKTDKYRTKLKDSYQEKLRERRIFGLALFCGFIVAFCAKANLISMFNEKKGVDMANTMGWELKDVSWDFNFLMILIGCFLTGIFLSLGSKFWHDLLDLLLQIKNYREKLVDEKTYQVSIAKELDEFLSFTKAELVEKAIDANRTSLMLLPNVREVVMGTKIENNSITSCATIHLKDNDRSNIPNHLFVALPSGKPIKIDVDIIDNVETPKAAFAYGIEHFNFKDYIGTTGCVLSSEEGKQYYLTCSHVVSNGSGKFNLKWMNENTTDSKKNIIKNITNAPGEEIGEVRFAKRNDFFDIALIEAKAAVSDKRFASKSRRITKKDILDGKNVTMEGFKSKTQKGQVAHIGYSTQIDYKGELYTLTNLIAIGRRKGNSWESISQPGDSGSIIYDEQNKIVLGMIIAGNSQFSYAIPMQSILDYLEMNIS
jgi:hypothetical protein